MNIYHTQWDTYYKAPERKDGNDAMVVGPSEHFMNALPEDGSTMLWKDIEVVIENAKRAIETLHSCGLSENDIDNPRVQEIIRQEMKLPPNSLSE